MQVKCTNGRFLNAFHSVGLLTDTVGYIVVSARIVIHPVVVDGYKSTEDALINDMHYRQSSAYMVLSVFHQHLNSFKLFFRNDGGVLAGVEILVSVLPVSSVLVLIQICGEGFPSQHISAIPFIGEDITDRASVPVSST